MKLSGDTETGIPCRLTKGSHGDDDRLTSTHLPLGHICMVTHSPPLPPAHTRTHTLQEFLVGYRKEKAHTAEEKKRGKEVRAAGAGAGAEAEEEEAEEESRMEEEEEAGEEEEEEEEEEEA